MTTTVTVIIACSLANYIHSGCVPDELWGMEVEECLVE